MERVTQTYDECEPIKTFDELLQWKYSGNYDWGKFTFPRKPKSENCCLNYGFDCHSEVNNFRPQPRIQSCSVPKTLVCHDLKGGYLEDRFTKGSARWDEYCFTHWAGIDTFVYFSHHFVTIPPLGWINAAHRHGVTVLGTLITEWDAGKALWRDMLAGGDKTQWIVVDQLAAVCAHYHFDGYLLNIENAITPDKLSDLVGFVSKLKSALKKIDAQLIWYDSVIAPSGALKWQNRLNKHNSCFFAKCDGIFLNYAWTEEDLRESVKAAGIRVNDVYVGVDVFGRGCYGGGGFNSNKAVAAARALGLSVALFAPAWTHERGSAPGPASHPARLYRDALLWRRLWPYLYVHGPARLPFTTSFCQGYGRKLYSRGQVVSEKGWYNIGKQAYQPTLSYCSVDGGAAWPGGCVTYYDADAYHGGGCLLLSKPCDKIMHVHRLMLCEFRTYKKRSLCISVAIKQVAADSDTRAQLTLALLVVGEDDRYSRFLLSDSLKNTEEFCKDGDKYCPPEVTTTAVFCDTGKLQGASNGWLLQNYVVSVEGGTVIEIGGILIGGDFLLLGYLAFEERDNQTMADINNEIIA